MRPRKYFCATMLVAVCDQNFGNSTSFCSKAGPSLPGISASRVSHSISSNGSRPGMVKKRLTPTFALACATAFSSCSSVISTVSTAFADAICRPPTPIPNAMSCALARAERRGSSGPPKIEGGSDGISDPAESGRVEQRASALGHDHVLLLLVELERLLEMRSRLVVPPRELENLGQASPHPRLVVDLVAAVDDLHRFARQFLGRREVAPPREDLRLRPAPEGLRVEVVARRRLAAAAGGGPRPFAPAPRGERPGAR